MCGVNNFPAAKAYGLLGTAQYGAGIYATSGTGNAGIFVGSVSVSGALGAASVYADNMVVTQDITIGGQSLVAIIALVRQLAVQAGIE